MVVVAKLTKQYPLCTADALCSLASEDENATSRSTNTITWFHHTGHYALIKAENRQHLLYTEDTVVVIQQHVTNTVLYCHSVLDS